MLFIRINVRDRSHRPTFSRFLILSLLICDLVCVCCPTGFFGSLICYTRNNEEDEDADLAIQGSAAGDIITRSNYLRAYVLAFPGRWVAFGHDSRESVSRRHPLPTNILFSHLPLTVLVKKKKERKCYDMNGRTGFEQRSLPAMTHTSHEL